MRWMASALAAALIVAAQPAGAWSPRKRDDAPKVRACPELGEGYVRVPGTDTCVKVGGSVRVEGAAISR